MSVDLDFWRYKEGAAHDNDKVYRLACCDGETVEGLEDLPIEDILKKTASVFSDWNALSENIYEKDDASFEISVTPQIVRFDCYGVSEDDMNRFIDIMADFGCPLYDPQISTRFDSWTDR